MNDFYVYMYLRSNDSKYGITGSPYYIGKGRANRAFDIRTHTRRPSDLSRIIFIAKNLNETDAFQIEMLAICLHGRIDKGTGILRNRTDGGEGLFGHIPSPESIEKRAMKMRGHLVSKETRRKISEAQKGNIPWNAIKASSLLTKGKPRNPEHIKKSADAMRGKNRPKFSKEWKENLSKAHIGTKMPPRSDEHRLKLAKAQTGRIYSKASRNKMVLSHTGKRASEETKLKMSLSQKARRLKSARG